MFWGVDIGQSVVEYDDISFLPDDFEPAAHIDYLKEDMLQIRLPGNILIDVGWRPSFEGEGNFYITAVKNDDWTDPLFTFVENNVRNTKIALRKIVEKTASRSA
jgi:hypothetical protein